MTTISIADDHKLFRQGIIALLETIENVSFHHEAANGEDLLRAMNQAPSDIVLIDINMPEMDGLACSKAIKKKFPDTKIIILSMHADHETIEQALKIGVDGYLPKDTEKSELELAIQTVEKGERHFNDSVTRTIIDGLTSPQMTQPIRLTPREKDVLKLICEEYTTQEIADQLFISFNTVETHRKNLLHKTGSKNSLGLLKFAIENNLFKH